MEDINSILKNMMAGLSEQNSISQALNLRMDNIVNMLKLLYNKIEDLNSRVEKLEK